MIKNNAEIPFGYKDSALGVIPQEWEVKEFGLIASRGKDKYNPSNNNNVKCLELEHFEQDMGIINGWVNASEQKSIKNVFSKGDILFGKLRPYLKKYWLAEFDGVCSSEVWVLEANQKLCLKNYLYRLIQTHRFIQIANVSSGSKMPRADWDYVSMMPMLVPPLEEQRRIAEVLGCWDEAIERQRRMVELLTTRKRALMQRLLTPQSHWQKTKLGEICDIRTGSKNNEDKIQYGKYPFYVRSQNIERIDTYSYDCEAILIPGEGKIGEVVHYIDGKFDYHQRVYKISHFSGTYGKYIYYYLKHHFARQAVNNSVKACVDSLRLPMFTEMKVTLPSITEQKTIAEKLSTADAEIDLARRRLDLLRTQKRALMQQLLTGKKQVK